MENPKYKIVFCPILYNNIEKDLKISKNPNPISGHKFQENIIRGLIANNSDMLVINTPRIRSYPYTSKIFVRSSKFFVDDTKVGINIGFINLPLISRITKKASLRKYLYNEIRDNIDIPYVLMTFNSYDIQSEVFEYIKRKFRNIYTCDIIADLHGKYGIKNFTKGLRGYFINRIENKQDEFSKIFDSYVLLTEDMKNVIGFNNKPYVVVEGLYNVNKNMPDMTKDNKNEYIIFYAGSLFLKYGIKHLLKSFSMIEKENYRLVIAGIGDGEELVHQYAKEDNRILYLGFISPEETEQWQIRADVLVSPRQTKYEYVKYSFPSKTMECLASGKPYVAHKLPCEPDEYGNYIRYPRDESDLALKDELIRVCELPMEVKKQIGIAARNFILSEKNPKRMCRKILDMLNKMVTVYK